MVYKDGKAQLLRHGKPYHIRGGGGHEQMEKLALYGGNSIRTWTTEDAGRILDEAEANGLTVTLGLEVGRQWWGEDFNYWNLGEVDQKIDELKKVVEKYKDHPALLMWGIGNEVYLFGGNRHIIYHTINKIAKMIHETDPNHPVMTSIPVGFEFDRYTLSFLLMPDVDILGFNAFARLPDVYSQVYGPTGWGKPYILSEWGPSGHWELKDNTEWGAPKELSSSEKAKIVDGYWETIEKDSALYLGNYAFYWGHKFEVTHTWFSLFSQEGYETESLNVLRSKWSGNDSINWAPRIDSVGIESTMRRYNYYLLGDSVYQASVHAHDPDNDSLSYRWELRHEGLDFYQSGKFDYNMEHLVSEGNSETIRFQAPKEIGGYRLFTFVYDGQGNVATHNIPFYVTSK
ncbi:glycoside hydrolase family 2 TIM barrel-domain containing protein [Algoriphagus aestuariicola]